MAKVDFPLPAGPTASMLVPSWSPPPSSASIRRRRSRRRASAAGVLGRDQRGKMSAAPADDEVVKPPRYTCPASFVTRSRRRSAPYTGRELLQLMTPWAMLWSCRSPVRTVAVVQEQDRALRGR